ncbi:MAG: metallophosphoesterase [Campylobacterota bacterium]
MIIDILSDLHVDFYFRSNKPPREAVEATYSNILTDFETKKVGDVLIVAGDIGHNNEQNISVLKNIKEIFEYKHIIFVLGNHDYYLIDIHSRSDYNGFSLNRAEEMRQLINDTEGMCCLDGEVVEIDGVRIGGCDGWYDGEYIRKHFNKKSKEYMDGYVSLLWERTMADAHYIFGMDWQGYAKKEKNKIEKIYQDVDVMITHINPSIKKEHTNKIYRDEDTTGYFTFDGSKYLKDGSMKYWVYGHTHIEAEHEIDRVKCICNPMGYPNERNGIKMKSIEITGLEK